MPTNLDHQYIDGSGNTWTYHPPPRDSFTRGPGDTGGNYAHWWVVDRYGPLTWAATAAAVASLTTERDRALRVIRNAHQAIRENTTAAAVALAMFDTRDQHGPSILDELKVAEAERDAAQALLVEEQRDHAATRALAVTCSCGTSPMTYEGPEPDCAVHGAVQAYNQAAAELERQRPVVEAARAWVKASKHVSDTGAEAKQHLIHRGELRVKLVAAVDALDTPTSPSSSAQGVPQERVADHAADLTGVDPAASAVRAEP